jgi:zinc/manganese transport system substrate-binding protein
MKKLFILILIIAVLSIQPATAITIVSTTTVLSDPIGYIGGDRVQVIAIADPTICPHMQAEIIPNRIQLDRDFITNADLFVAINGSVDKGYVMPYVEKFMKANNNANISWRTLKDPSMNWNTPGGARALSQESAKWLIDADPQNRTYYEGRLSSYLALIDAADLTTDERSQIAGQDVIVMLWQKEAAEEWLGLNVVSVFAPDFYNNGQSTPRAVINDIFDHPEKYRNVKYVIENMQSGDMAKGITEALHDNGIPAERVIFTNFPGSVAGVDTLPGVLRYNKGLVTPSAASAAARGTSALPSPLGVETALFGMGILFVGLHYRRKEE